MPRPIYILCSESQSVDRVTGLISLFHVIEGYTVTLGNTTEPIKESDGKPQSQPTLFAATFLINAVWMRQDHESEDDEFEHEFLMESPGAPPVCVPRQIVRFKKQFYRFSQGIQKVTPWPTTGICEIVSRIRKLGAEEWLQQSFPIPISVHFNMELEEAEGAQEQN